MGKISKQILKKLNVHRKPSSVLCKAPFCSMKISVDGRVSPCCANRFMEDLYPQKSLMKIWQGEVFKTYRKLIKNNMLPLSCNVCENALKSGSYTSAKLNQYNEFRIKKNVKNKPQVLELTLNNTCNLECVMCSGRYSSSIRKNREKLEPIDSLFDQNFLKDFVKLLPNLKEVIFVGGEPFLIPLYYDMWDEIIRLSPGCKISVVTNGTILNDRIIDLMERGNFKINLSCDSINKETYERIRVNAIFEKTMSNMEYFGNLLRNQGKQLNIPVCPLRLNRFEIPEIVRFCNKKRYSLVFTDVREAIKHAIWSLSKIELLELKDFYSNQSFDIYDENSQKNVQLFQELKNRLDIWIKQSEIVEQFENNFDLNNDQVDFLRNKLIDELKKGMSLKCLNIDEGNMKLENIMLTFDNVLKGLPIYFNSNHFYRKVLNISNLALIDGLMYYDKELISDIFREWFFYQ